MAAKAPEKNSRRVAVILGAGGSGRALLDQLYPLLGNRRNVEMQGVFLEEAEIQHAAELPFVKELCRFTFSVREFNSDQFEHALNLRMRTARRALSVLARRTGVSHTFRNVRGTAVSLVQETASDSDITVFEPVRLIAATLAQPTRSAKPRQRIVVVIDDLKTAGMTLLAAAQLAEGMMDRVTVITIAPVAGGSAQLDEVLRETLPARPAVRPAPGPDFASLIRAVQREGATMLVLGASDRILDRRVLRELRQQLRCPICLVRRWGGSRKARSAVKAH
jgi:hypothetical protein